MPEGRCRSGANDRLAGKSETAADMFIHWPLFGFRRPSLAGLVVIAGSLNPIPSRTRPLNSLAPMVLSLKAWKSRSLPGLPRTSIILITIILSTINLFERPPRTAAAPVILHLPSSQTMRAADWRPPQRATAAHARGGLALGRRAQRC